MWMPQVSVLELIFRGVVVYLVLFALLRFIGKKHVGELSPFDLGKLSPGNSHSLDKA